MPKRHLTNDERAIRRSAGILLWRIVPFVMVLIALVIMSSDQQLFKECIGKPLETGGRFGVWFRLVAAIWCSGYYVRDYSDHWMVIATFCVGAALAIPQRFWIERHEAYWNTVRERQRLKRAEKTLQKEVGSEGRRDEP